MNSLPTTWFRLRSWSPDNGISVFRLILAIAVIHGHSCWFLDKDPEHGHDPVSWITGRQQSSGYFAVNIFFGLSGFLVTASWFRCRGVLDYLTRRFLRIYPAFIAVCLVQQFLFLPLGVHRWLPIPQLSDLCALAAGILSFGGLGPLFVGVPPDATLFDGLPSIGQINGSLWTIRYEMLCYLTVPVLAAFRLLTCRWFIIVAWLACSISYSWFCDYWDWPPMIKASIGPTGYVVRFASFFLGGVVAFFEAGALLRFRRLGLVALAGWALLSLVLGDRAPGVSRLISALILPSAVILATYDLAIAPFGKRISADLSYGIYLYGWPIQLIVADRLTSIGLSAPILTVLASVAVLVPSYLSWRYVEAPALKLRPSRQSG